MRTRGTRTACHGYSGENFDQLRRDQKGHGREGEESWLREREKLVRLRMPSRTKVQTNLFDPPNEKRLGGFPNPDPPTTIPPPSDSPPSSSDQIFSQPKLRRLPSFLLVRASIVRGFGGGPRERRRSRSDPIRDSRPIYSFITPPPPFYTSQYLHMGRTAPQ